MKLFKAFPLLLILAFSMLAQKPDDILATVGKRNFTVRDLAPETQKVLQNQPAIINQARSQMLSQMIADLLFETEAKASGTTAEKLLDGVNAKVPNPTDADVSAIYEANRAVFGEKTLASVKPQIVSFLRREPEQKAVQNLVDALRIKHKTLPGKDINAVDLKSSDAVASVGGKTISAQEFEEKNKIALYEIRADIFDRVSFDLKTIVSNELLAMEAAELKIDTSDIRAREVTDKMREFSDEERINLEAVLQKRLFIKYKPQFLYKEPAPVVQSISTDDDPSRGRANAPVTVVMFSDFQCPACGATHPIIKKIIAEYGDQVRFVVRDFPLTDLHENAFRAALAAKAAFNQGKFFEYSDKLYSNQNALDEVSLKKYAADLGLNLKQFEIDLTDEKTAAEVREDIADGKNYGIKGTPTIYVNGIAVRTLSEDGFREAIDRELKK